MPSPARRRCCRCTEWQPEAVQLRLAHPPTTPGTLLRALEVSMGRSQLRYIHRTLIYALSHLLQLITKRTEVSSVVFVALSQLPATYFMHAMTQGPVAAFPSRVVEHQQHGWYVATCKFMSHPAAPNLLHIHSPSCFTSHSL